MKPVKPHAHDSDMAAVSAYARILGPRSDRNQKSDIDSTYSSLTSSPIKETREGDSSKIEQYGSESDGEIDSAEKFLEPGRESEKQGDRSRRIGKKRSRKFAPSIHKSLSAPNNFSFQSRQTYLNALLDYVIVNAKEIENSLARDGLCKWDVVGELNCVLGEIENLRNSFGNWLGEKNEATGRRYFRFPSFFSSISLFNRYATTATTSRHPIGSILLVPSHIHPLQSLFTPLAASIAGGNRSLIKLNALAPSFSEFLRSSLKEWINVDVAEIVGGETTAQMSIEREDERMLREVKEVSELIEKGVDMVWARVDGMSKTMATELSKLASVNPNTPFIIETGGICPVIIDSSVPLSVASNRIIHGKFTWAGQSPTSPSFLIVISPTSSAPSPSPDNSSKSTSLPLYLKQNFRQKVQPDLTKKIILHLRKTLVRHYSLDPSSSLDYTRIITRSDYHLLKKLMSEEPGQGNSTTNKENMSASESGVWVNHHETDAQKNDDFKVESEIESEFENESENGVYAGGDNGFLVERAIDGENYIGESSTEFRKGKKPEIKDPDTSSRVRKEGKATVSADFNDETRYIAPKIVDMKVEGMEELIQHDVRGPILPVVEVASFEEAITFLQNRYTYLNPSST
ncbi:Aldehyde/histidinol dehydrogenase [Paraphysoderma sedebokerense]|nr:Aldehyde/histidinol dehydrogenase [Paraphysoderma sedebokerense]